MSSMKCPGCKNMFELKEGDAPPGRTVRCPNCGVSVPVAPPAADLAFPKKGTEETVLDLSDTVKAVRRQAKNTSLRRKDEE